MKLKFVIMSLIVLLSAGYFSVGLVSAKTTKTENYATFAISCNKPGTASLTNFNNNGKTNTVNLLLNGKTYVFSFVGASATYSYPVTGTNGSYIFSANWKTNGQNSSEPNDTINISNCGTSTTTTTSHTTTTTTPSTTSTPTTSTVYTSTNVITTTTTTPTTTVSTTLTAPKINCHNGYTQTGAYSCKKIVVKKIPSKLVCPTNTKNMKTYCLKTTTKTVIVIKWKKTKLTVAEQCVSIKDNDWINGVCGGLGRG